MALPPTALCLSGGGFRATLFHLGAVRRLNQLGILSKLDVITSVSGGSILNGILATGWQKLVLGDDGVFTNFREVIADEVTRFCGMDLRTRVLLGARVNPANWGALFRDFFSVRANHLADGYRGLLPQKLAELPSPRENVPRFVFIATNVATGVSWQFHCGRDAKMGDFHTGYWPVESTGVAEAVAASSAFPPGFSALRLRVPESDPDRIDPWGEYREADPVRENQRIRTRTGCVLLTDGGVYDNLGFEPVWKRGHWLLVSDAQQSFRSEPDSSQALIPRLARAVDICMGQVSALRKRWLIDRVRTSGGAWSAAIWRLAGDPTSFPTSEPGYGADVRARLVCVRTDLNAFTPEEMGCLQNVGYWVADAAVRSHWKGPMTKPGADFEWPDEAQAVNDVALESLGDSHRRRYWRDLWGFLRGL